MLHYKTVPFSDIEVTLGGARFWASGDFYVGYTVHRGDRSVGEPAQYVEVDFPAEIVMTLTDEDGEEVMEAIADWREDLFQTIINEIAEDAVYMAEREEGIA